MTRAIAVLVLVCFSALGASPTGAPPNASTLNAAQIDDVLVKAHAAAGGAQLDTFASMTQSGTFVQNGGTANPFNSATDLRNGYWLVRSVVGPATLLQGYDGTEWAESNGSLSVVSLPSFVADAITQAYISSNAFFRANERPTVVSGRQEILDGRAVYVLHVEPTGGSSADLYFDGATYRLVQIVAQTAGGIDTTTNSNFKTIQGLPVAMRSVDVDPSGTTTVTTADSVHFSLTVDTSALARPAYISHGTLVAPASIPFVSDMVGGLGHIVIPVTLDGKGATLIFDSGGGDFLVPGAVNRLGLHASGGVATGGAGNKEQMSAFTRVSTVDFGGARLSDQNFIVTPLPYPIEHPRQGIATAGLIGFEYLANFRITVRYAQHRIDVASFDQAAPTGGVTLPFKSDGSHAYVLGTIDGVPGLLSARHRKRRRHRTQRAIRQGKPPLCQRRSSLPDAGRRRRRFPDNARGG